MFQYLLVVSKAAVILGILGGVAIWLFAPFQKWKVILGVAWCLTYIIGFELASIFVYRLADSFAGPGGPPRAEVSNVVAPAAVPQPRLVGSYTDPGIRPAYPVISRYPTPRSFFPGCVPTTSIAPSQ